MCIGGGSSVGPPTRFAYRLTQLTFLFALGYRSDKQEPEQIMNAESLAHHDEWARSVFLDERLPQTTGVAIWAALETFRLLQ